MVNPEQEVVEPEEQHPWPQPRSMRDDAEEADAVVMSGKNKCSRRKDKRIKQRERREFQKGKKIADATEEENRKIRKQVSKLQTRDGTNVQEDVDLRELEQALQKEYYEIARGQQRRENTLSPTNREELSLSHHLMSSNSRGEKMRNEIIGFLDSMDDSCCDVKPVDGKKFADELVRQLLKMGASSSACIDYAAAKAVFGNLAETFLKIQWKESILRHANERHVVVAAALCE